MTRQRRKHPTIVSRKSKELPPSKEMTARKYLTGRRLDRCRQCTVKGMMAKQVKLCGSLGLNGVVDTLL